MSKAVIDRLKSVQIEQHHTRQAIGPVRVNQRLLQPVSEQIAVGQTCQCVGIGLHCEGVRVALDHIALFCQ